MKRAVEKKMPFDFSYLILICKLHQVDSSKKKSRKNQKKSNEPDIIWSNQEDEIIDQVID